METLATHAMERDLGKQQSPHGSHERPHSGWDLVHEFIVDVLGILLPGTLFTVVVLVLLAASGVCFLNVFRVVGKQELELAGVLGGLVNGPYVWLLLIVGYVVGGTFFRQDPRGPDEKSIKWILSGSPRRDLRRFEVQTGAFPRKMWKNGNSWCTPICGLLGWSTADRVGRKEAAAIAHSASAKFPYSQLKQALTARGFSHLAKLVPGHRSRVFINVLKIRLQLVAPDKCADVVRNEAHVRMMSSVWFAARTLSVFCWLSVLPVLAAVYSLCSEDGLSLRAAALSHDVMTFAGVFLFVIVSTFWLRRHVESCIHYQRFREAYYVLEAAFFLAHSGHPEILDDLG